MLLNRNGPRRQLLARGDVAEPKRAAPPTVSKGRCCEVKTGRAAIFASLATARIRRIPHQSYPEPTNSANLPTEPKASSINYERQRSPQHPRPGAFQQPPPRAAVRRPASAPAPPRPASSPSRPPGAVVAAGGRCFLVPAPPAGRSRNANRCSNPFCHCERSLAIPLSGETSFRRRDCRVASLLAMTKQVRRRNRNGATVATAKSPRGDQTKPATIKGEGNETATYA